MRRAQLYKICLKGNYTLKDVRFEAKKLGSEYACLFNKGDTINLAQCRFTGQYLFYG